MAISVETAKWKVDADLEDNVTAKSKKMFDQFKINSQNSFNAFSIGLTAVTAATIAFTKQALTTADEIGKFADRVGITTDVLQELRFAFDKAGVSAEETDQALLTFGKRLGKAHQGIGALAGGLKGGQEELLRTLTATNSTTEGLEVLFNALGEAKTQTEKLAIADAAFGGAGLKMTAAFQDAGKSFNSAREEAQRLGVVIDEKLIRNAEKANDEMSKVSQILTVKVQKAFLELAPLISSAADALIKFSIVLNDLFKNTEGTSISQSLENVRADIEKTEKFLGSFATKLDAALFGDELIKEAKQRLESLKITLKALEESGKLEGIKKGVEDLSTVAGTASEKFKVLSNSVQEIGSNKRLTELKALFEQMQALDSLDLKPQFGFASDESSPIAQNFRDSLKGDREEIEKYSAAFDRAQQVIASTQTPLDILLEKQTELNQLLGMQLITAEQHSIAWDLAANEFQNSVSRMKDSGESGFASLERAIDQLSSGMENRLTDSIQSMTFSLEGFRDFTVDLLQEIQREFIRTSIAKPIVSALSGGVGDILGGIAGSLFGFAKGGSFDVPGGGGTDSQLVGFRATPGERVTVETPAQQKTGNGITVNQTLHFNIHPGVSQTIRAEVMTLAPSIVKMAKAEIINAQNRNQLGGAFG